MKISFLVTVLPYVPDKAAKIVARQAKFGFVNPDAEKRAMSAWLANEQAQKKAKRIARFGEDTTAKNSAADSKTGNGKDGGGGKGKRNKGGRGGGKGRQGQPMNATTMLSQGLSAAR